VKATALGSTTGTYWSVELKTVKVFFATDGADVVSGHTAGPVNVMALSVPPLALSLKIVVFVRYFRCT
jgi:hypothetical protein